MVERFLCVLPLLYKMIDIQRPAYDQVTFDDKYGKVTTQKPSGQQITQYFHRKCTCSIECFKKQLLLLFPFIMTLKTYKWKDWILKDMMAGLSVGAINVPLCLGLSILTSLPPVYGLYSSIFPVIIYFFLGTSRHISMGTLAVICIMIGAVVDREVIHFETTKQSITGDSLNMTAALPENKTAEHMDKFKLDIVLSLSFIVGIFQMAMSFLKVGSFANYMSSSFIGGLATAAASHLITSQITFALGYKIPIQIGLFRVPKSWYLILKSITKTNPAEVITFVSCLIIVIILKTINNRFKKKLKIPIPIELIVIAIYTLISYLGNFHERFSMSILKQIPTGIPGPVVPSFYRFQTYILDAFVISLISYSMSISFARKFSEKYRYPIDQNQELFALGVMHTISSFFNSFVGTQAPARTLVNESAGGKTQVSSLFAAALALLVCLVLAPAFEPLPNSALAAVIIIAVAPLFKQFITLPHLWHLNKQDCIVWLVTYFSCVILNTDIGIAIGIGIGVFSLVIETQWGRGEVLSGIDCTDLYQSSVIYSGLTLPPSPTKSSKIFIFRYEAPLYFANVENFKNQLFKATINPIGETQKKTIKDSKNKFDIHETDPKHCESKFNIHETVSKTKKFESKSDNNDATNKKTGTCENIVSENSISLISLSKSLSCEDAERNHTAIPVTSESICVDDIPTTNNYVIVLDCSTLCYIDLMGLNTLQMLQEMYLDVNVQLVYTNCSQSLLHKMKVHGMDVTNSIYPSIHDAVTMKMQKEVFTTHF